MKIKICGILLILKKKLEISALKKTVNITGVSEVPVNVG